MIGSIHNKISQRVAFYSLTDVEDGGMKMIELSEDTNFHLLIFRLPIFYWLSQICYFFTTKFFVAATLLMPTTNLKIERAKKLVEKN